jgi:hypothetical protein
MKVILDLCAGTGAWSEPYRQAGYWEYGDRDRGHKPTCIWGDFVPPMKRPVPLGRAIPSTWQTSNENALPRHAQTPAGFAQAFFEASP